MKISKAATLIMVVVVGALVMVNCKQKSALQSPPEPGAAEQAGAALDRAAEQSVETSKAIAEKTSEAVNSAATKTEAVAEKAVEKTGEALENAGAAVEKTGSDLQQ